jgi:UDP-3-O-[3-hydroxymyristoyl] glucosamine N-acyltransferase
VYSKIILPLRKRQNEADLTKISVTEVADFLGGTVEGKHRDWFFGISKIDDGQPNTLTFLSNPKYVDYLTSTEADIILIDQNQSTDSSSDKTFIRVDDPYLGFCEVLNVYFNPSKNKIGIDPSSSISSSAAVGKNAYIGSNVAIGDDVKIGLNAKIYPNTTIGDDVEIGDNALIFSHVSIYHDCKIGDDIIVHAGTVIGSDGFGHAPKPDGGYVKIPQIGNVIIGNQVEIGANCTIDRATLGSTIIGNGVKLDNLIQVAHNVEIGDNTVIASQSGISGSTTLGERCVVGGQVGFAGHLKIANGTQVGAQSGLGKSIVEENTRQFGSPVMPLKDALRTQLIIRDLPSMRDKLIDVEKTLKVIAEEINKKSNSKD